MCFHSPGKNLRLSHSAIKEKKKKKAADTPSRSDAGFPAPKTLPEQGERVQMAPRFSAHSQALTKPQRRKNREGLLQTDFSPGLRAAVAASHIVEVIKDLLAHKKPITSITASIPLQKRSVL